MDSLTQIVLGASIQGALLGRQQGRKALACGALLGTLPDLDVMLSYPDPVSLMTYHRGFSHSLFVLTAVAALLTWLVRRGWPRAPYTARRLFLTLWLVLVTHPLLDAFTVYGTQLFWPLPTAPESWSAVFVIDPVYTLPLLGAVVLALCTGLTRTARRALAAAVLFGTAYLFFGLAGRWHAEQAVQAELRRHGVTATHVLAVPTPFNTLVWRTIAKTDRDTYYEAASSWFDRTPPEMLALPLHDELSEALAHQPLHTRLRWFTNDWLRYDEIDGKLVVTDLRLGVAGYYSFRFVMAEREGKNWVMVTPRRWPSDRGGWPQLALIFKRVWAETPPLPLAAWAQEALR